MRKQALKASFTIEAAVIIPFFLILLYALIYFTFFLYNHAVLQQEISHIAICNSIEQTGGSKAKANTINSNQFLSLQNLQIEKEEIKNEIIVKTELHMKVPLQNVMELFFQTGTWEMKKEARANIVEPAKFIRRCRRMEAIKENRNDGSGVQKKYSP